MPRIARVVGPGMPHHVTQRGNRRQVVFFNDDDYRAYKDLLAAWCEPAGVAVWAYCLMPNHVHLILVPKSADGLHRALGEAHRRYTRMVNFREGWRGYFWQGRFASVVLDQHHLLAVARYVEMNPVRARLAAKPGDWPWSSARPHLSGHDDGLVETAPLLAMVDDWQRFLDTAMPEEWEQRLREHQRTGRPLGDLAFLKDLEQRLGRHLLPQKTGPKPKTKPNQTRRPHRRRRSNP